MPRGLLLLLLLLPASGCISIRMGPSVLVDTNGALGAQATLGVGLGYTTSDDRMVFFSEEGGLGPSEDGVDYGAYGAVDLATMPEDPGLGWRIGARFGTRGTLMHAAEIPTIVTGPRATLLWAFDHSASRDEGEKFQLYSGTIESWQSVGLEAAFDVSPLAQDGHPRGIATFSAVYEITSRYE